MHIHTTNIGTMAAKANLGTGGSGGSRAWASEAARPRYLAPSSPSRSPSHPLSSTPSPLLLLLRHPSSSFSSSSSSDFSSPPSPLTPPPPIQCWKLRDGGQERCVVCVSVCKCVRRGTGWISPRSQVRRVPRFAAHDKQYGGPHAGDQPNPKWANWSGCLLCARIGGIQQRECLPCV